MSKPVLNLWSRELQESTRQLRCGPRSWEKPKGGQQGVCPGSRPLQRRGREHCPSCRTCREPAT
eukprot:3742125-Rhodomonas_salina.1